MEQKRLAFRIADHLPKWMKIIYYIVLLLTLVYWIYRLIEWVLVTIQKLGAFIFEPRNYWAAVMSLFIVLIGAFIMAQFVLGLDPYGNFISWIKQSFQSIVEGLKSYAGN